MTADLERLFRLSTERAQSKATLGAQRCMRRIEQLGATYLALERRGYTFGGVSAAMHAPDTGNAFDRKEPQ